MATQRHRRWYYRMKANNLGVAKMKDGKPNPAYALAKKNNYKETKIWTDTNPGIINIPNSKPKPTNTYRVAPGAKKPT